MVTSRINSVGIFAFLNRSSTAFRLGAIQQQIAWLFWISMYERSIFRSLPTEASFTFAHAVLICSFGMAGRVIKNAGICTSLVDDNVSSQYIPGPTPVKPPYVPLQSSVIRYN